MSELEKTDRDLSKIRWTLRGTERQFGQFQNDLRRGNWNPLITPDEIANLLNQEEREVSLNLGYQRFKEHPINGEVYYCTENWVHDFLNNKLGSIVGIYKGDIRELINPYKFHLLTRLNGVERGAA